MPELPDVTLYVECLQTRLRGQSLDRLRIAHPFVLRSFDPPVEASYGHTVIEVSRLGKRIVLALSNGLLLPYLPDPGTTPSGSRAVTPVAQGLAALPNLYDVPKMCDYARS